MSCYSYMIQFLRELYLKDIWEMSDKKLDLMLKRVRPYMSCIHIMHTTDHIAVCVHPHRSVVVAVVCTRIA